MPRQRFIHPDLWTDPSLGQVSAAERLLFIGCFSNADDEGRLLGSPAFLRATIFPYDDLSLDEVRAMRDRIVSKCKNLVLYQVNGLEYLAFLKWSKYQKPKYPKPSKLPPPCSNDETISAPISTNDGESFPLNEGNDGGMMGEDLPPRLGLDRDGFGMGLDRDGMGTGREYQQTPSGGEPEVQETSEPGQEMPQDATEREREILHELKQVSLFPDDYSKNLAYIRTLSTDFPRVDILGQAKKWRIYKLDKPLVAKSNPRLQFRNWCEIAAKRQAETTANSNRGSPNHPIPRGFASLEEWARRGGDTDG